MVPVGASRSRTRRTATGTSGRRRSRATFARGWCSPATRTRRGPTTTRPARGTTTASTTSSPTSTWRTPGCDRRSRRSSGSGCSSACPASAWTPRRSSSSSRCPTSPRPRKDFSWLNDFREQLSWRRGDAVILAEANVEARAVARVLRRRPPPADAVQLHPQSAHLPRPGPPEVGADPAGAGRDPDGAGHLPVGDLPAQPRRGRPRSPGRPRARRGLRRLRARSVDAALRARHPSSAGADARQ